MRELDDDLLEYFLQIGALRPEEERLARMRSRAEALRGQQYKPGQMVSGHYIPTSGLQDLATFAGQLAGAYGEYKADQAEDELRQRRRAILEDFAQRAARRGVNPAVDYAKAYGSQSDEPGY
jgi:hypothetical protein